MRAHLTILTRKILTWNLGITIKPGYIRKIESLQLFFALKHEKGPMIGEKEEIFDLINLRLQHPPLGLKVDDEMHQGIV